MLDVPFANVVDPEFGAAGNGTGDDAPAFQAAVDYMYSHYGGGPICVPPGDFCFGGDAGIIMKGACRLVGSGRSLSVINALATDIDVVTFDSSCSAAGMTELGVYGYNNPRATKSAVTVAPNALVNLRNSNIWFGKNGLAHAGVDGIVDDCYIQGRQYGVLSTGANWYHRCKIDTDISPQATAAFAQITTTAAVLENHLSQCDLSGTYELSLHIDDGGYQSAVTTLGGCVFGNAINIFAARATMIGMGEFGNQSFLIGESGGMVLVSGFAFAPTKIVSRGQPPIIGPSFNLS
jgi:hypothetical protein